MKGIPVRRPRHGSSGWCAPSAEKPRKCKFSTACAANARFLNRKLRGCAAMKIPNPCASAIQAAEQFQLDIFGETADALYQARRGNVDLDPRDLELTSPDGRVSSHCVADILTPAFGRSAGYRAEFVYSNAMAWVTLDRAIKSFEEHGMEGPVEEWRGSSVRKLHDDVCRNGIQSQAPIALWATRKPARSTLSLLLLPLVGFLPGNGRAHPG